MSSMRKFSCTNDKQDSSSHTQLLTNLHACVCLLCSWHIIAHNKADNRT